MVLSGAHTLSVIGDVIPLQTDFIYDAWDLLRGLAFFLALLPPWSGPHTALFPNSTAPFHPHIFYCVSPSHGSCCHCCNQFHSLMFSICIPCVLMVIFLRVHCCSYSPRLTYMVWCTCWRSRTLVFVVGSQVVSLLYTYIVKV